MIPEEDCQNVSHIKAWVNTATCIQLTGSRFLLVDSFYFLSNS